MDGDLTGTSLSDSKPEGGERDNPSRSPLSFSEAFDDHFPYYLSIGMTEEQYWDRDCCLVKAYRKADELRQEKENRSAWLQGMYIYDAISRLSPILRAFGKKGVKPKPYPDEPYPLTRKRQKEIERKKEKSVAQKGIRYLESFASKFNKSFAERK